MTRSAKLPLGTGVVDRFRLFYVSLEDLVRRLAAGEIAPSGTESWASTVERIQDELVELFDAWRDAAEDDPSADPLAESHARYLMTAFADERFVQLDWEGREAWAEATLEARLYQSDRAGEEVFRRIDQLLDLGDPGRRELGRLYLMALVLGFRGRLGDASATGWKAYRNRLIAFAAPPGHDESGDDRLLSPGAYRHTVSPARLRRLPAVRRWGVALVAVILAALALSAPIWWEATRPVREAISGEAAER